jgi:HAD superfamily hydrolase (TIGR01509 family)
MKYKAVIFDFDGTLADTFPGIYLSWEKTLKALDLGTISKDTVRKAIGPTRDTYLKLILGDRCEEHGEKALDLYKRIYVVESPENTFLYPRVGELLTTLKDMGISMGIASNKPHRQVLQLTGKFGITEFFSVVQGPEMVAEGTPAPAMFLACAEKWDIPAAAIVVVGDTALDMTAGRAAGMARAAALWGYSTYEVLARHKPEYFLDRPSDVLDVMI